MTLTLASHVGEVREHNEDAIGVDGWALQGDHSAPLHLELTPGTVHRVAVCDGMGGHGSGEVASRFAAEWLTTPVPGEAGSLTELRASARHRFQEASDRIVVDSRRPGVSTGMGTTAVLATLTSDQDEVLLAHVGDSRAYVLDGGLLSPLTRDDRVAADCPVLSQALGGGTLVALDVHTTTVRLNPGSQLLLCSDGLVDMVGDEGVARVLGTLERGAEEDMAGTGARRVVLDLLAAALGAGGLDNITVALVHAAPLPPSDEPEVLDIEI